ncbi:MAG: DUF3311 domain-containing protein [Rhizomicrobium sp.]
MATRRSGGFRLVHLLLLPPYIALLWVGSYNRVAPALWGIPFFYWYQLLWIPLGALLLYPIYRAEEREAAQRKDAP